MVKSTWKVCSMHCLFKLLRRLFGHLVKCVSIRYWNNEHPCKNLIGFANDFYACNGHNIFCQKERSWKLSQWVKRLDHSIGTKATEKLSKKLRTYKRLSLYTRNKICIQANTDTYFIILFTWLCNYLSIYLSTYGITALVDLSLSLVS
jgi:hypothetical protein